MTDQSNTPCPLSFKGIPYSDIINRWFSLAGGEPVEGERNDKLHRLASHLRYITDNNEETLLQIMPRYGLPEKEMKGLIHSACSAKWYSVPKLMQELVGLSHTPNAPTRAPMRMCVRMFPGVCNTPYSAPRIAQTSSQAYPPSCEPHARSVQACRGACGIPFVGNPFTSSALQVY